MVKDRINKHFSVLMIIIFVIIITTPLIFINKDSDKVSVLENKKLASFPKTFTKNNKLNSSFINEFETYINDNIGFKQEIVIGDIAFSYRLFNKLKMPNYIIGENENLFYTSNGVDIETIQGKNFFSESILKTLSQSITNMQNYFENNDANFYMMTIPNKENVYPELYSKEVKKISSKSRIDLLSEYMLKNTDVNILNVKDALKENKGTEMLYYKNYDCTHWNMNGAFIGYSQIMNRIKEEYPELYILEKDDFNITTEKTKGSFVQLSSLEIINKAMSFDDTIFKYNLKNGYHTKLSTDEPDGIELDVNDKYFHYVNSNSELPSILIIGDSYLYSNLLPILAESFSNLYFINFTSVQELITLQDTIKADIVLYEFVERMYYEGIYNELMNFKKTYIDSKKIDELPIIETEPALHVDIPLNKNKTIVLDGEEENVNIMGWGIDGMNETLASEIFLKVGDNYYRSKIVERSDLSSLKEEYMMAGFKFEILKEELIDAEYIEFIIISNDGTYRYRPVKFKVKS